MSQSDFVELVSSLTTFVRGERLAAYEEGITDMTAAVRDWVKLEGCEPSGEEIPDILSNYRDWKNGARE